MPNYDQIFNNDHNISTSNGERGEEEESCVTLHRRVSLHPSRNDVARSHSPMAVRRRFSHGAQLCPVVMVLLLLISLVILH